MEMTYRKLAYDEIYARIVRGKDPSTGQTVYFYYLVPFKEKVFFFPLRGLAEALDRGEVCEITLKPHDVDKNRCILVSYKVYPSYVENKLWKKNMEQKLRNLRQRY